MLDKMFSQLVLLLVIEVTALVLIFAGLNFFIFSSFRGSFRVYDWFLLEGIFCIIISALFALGRGGINAYTLRSAATVAATDALYGNEYKVSDVFRRDKWKPQSFPKAALVLLICGIALLAIYFLTL